MPGYVGTAAPSMRTVASFRERVPPGRLDGKDGGVRLRQIARRPLAALNRRPR